MQHSQLYNLHKPSPQASHHLLHSLYLLHNNTVFPHKSTQNSSRSAIEGIVIPSFLTTKRQAIIQTLPFSPISSGCCPLVSKGLAMVVVICVGNYLRVSCTKQKDSRNHCIVQKQGIPSVFNTDANKGSPTNPGDVILLLSY